MAEERCCVCGRVLPNRYAVAGRCKADGCGAAFCSLHWHTRVRLCPFHGGGAMVKTAEAEEPVVASEDGKPAHETVAGLAVRLGKGVSSLIDRIRGVQDPAAVMASLDAQLSANREYRIPLQQHYERLYGEIVAKKKAYRSAPPARKKLLELELKSQIAEFRSVERQLTICLENERVVSVVRARMQELAAMGLGKLRGKDIDELTDRLAAAVDEHEDVAEAVCDLDKAGERHDRDDADQFAADLAGFDEAASAAMKNDDAVCAPVSEADHADQELMPES